MPWESKARRELAAVMGILVSILGRLVFNKEPREHVTILGSRMKNNNVSAFVVFYWGCFLNSLH